MALNAFDLATTRRLSVSLMAASGGLLITALNLVGGGVSSGNEEYAVGISKAVWPLATSAGLGLLALICAEIAGHSKTPDEGHPHSKRNYLETAFVLIGLFGLGYLMWGGAILLSAATVTVTASS